MKIAIIIKDFLVQMKQNNTIQWIKRLWRKVEIYNLFSKIIKRNTYLKFLKYHDKLMF